MMWTKISLIKTIVGPFLTANVGNFFFCFFEKTNISAIDFLI